MATQCPKCLTENTKDSVFCKKCATPLRSSDELSVTKTILKSTDELAIRSIFAEKYKVMAEIGRGGMGVVYKAEDLKLKRFVAIKILPSELASDEEAKGRFVQEAQAAAALSHPNICTIYEVEESEGKIYIAMEYIEGHSLKKKTVKGPLSAEEALEVAIQVAQGLTEAHKKGITHRDIKSANIMVDEKGRAKIMDFGLAKIAGSALITKEAKTMGTVAYMSPEQAQGEAVDHRTDIWSTGVVLYESLTGQLPFRGEHDQSMIYSILNGEPKPIVDLQKNVPKELEQVIGKALKKNPDERYQQVGDLLDDLRAIAKGLEPFRLKEVAKRVLKVRKSYLYPGIAVLTILFVVAGFVLLTGPRPLEIDSIAVLPLENLAEDPGQEYFVDGMTDALIAQLSQISGLHRVISRTSIMVYKDVRKPLPEIARELNVDVVVEGTVLRAGDRVRITIQLIDALKDRNMWAKDYERNLGDVLALQKEVAQSIANEIKLVLKPEEEARLASKQPVNPRALDALLKGTSHSGKMTVEDLILAKQSFEQAIDIDPNFAQAHASLARVYIQLSLIASLPIEETFPKAKAAAEKALKLNESLGEAHAALASAMAMYDWDWLGADQAFRRALELQPGSSSIHASYGWFLSWMGRHDEAIAESRRSVELDPFSAGPITNLSMVLSMARQFDEALEAAKRAIEMAPIYNLAYERLAEAYKGKGMHKETITALQKTVDLSGGSLLWKSCLGHAYAVAGRKDEAIKILNELIAPSNQGKVFSENIAWIYLGLGEKEKALLWLEKAFDAHDPNMTLLKVWPAWDPLRDDPRFKTLLKRMNLD